MTNKIIFGADLIDVLEHKYNMNKLGEVPTKYKNGIATIDFIYGKEKDIDDLKYDKPYVEFTVDDETDGFISGTMYPNGGIEGIQFDSYDDIKYFMKNAKWTEWRKSLKESNQITANIWEWQRLLNGVCNFTNWITRTFVKGETLHKVLEKIYRNEEITLDEFVNACIDYIGDYQFEEKINEYVKQYLSTNDKIKNAFKTKGIKVVESKKSVSGKSLKEGIDIKIVYADDTPSEYIDDVTHNDILDIIEESPEVYKIFDVSGSKKKLVWSDEYGFERAYESKKSTRKGLKESLNSDIKLMVNRIVDDLIAEYTPREWDSLSDNEKFNIIRIKYFMYEGKSKYLSEVRDLVIENMNHPFDVVFESKKSMKESKASLHEDNVEYGVERIRNKVKGSDVTYYFDDEDCFIDVTEKNGNLWAFTIDFGSGYVYMLEPKEDRGSFGADNEAFDVIISMLQGKRFNEKKSLKEQFVGKGEGGYKKPRANKSNSGICEDSNGINHKVIFDTHVEDFIVWVDNDNYLMWNIYSAKGLKRNLLKSDLDEKLIDEIAELGKQLIHGFDTDF